MKRLILNTLYFIPKRLFSYRGFSRRNKLASTLILIVLTLFTSLYAWNALHPQSTSAAWFNDNWGYRQIVAITNAGTAQTDYQVAITLDTATLITAGKMRSDCNDIRITDINGKLLPQWIETGATGAGGKACNASTTQIWTKVPSLPTSGQTVYLYYGNPTAPTTQTPQKVFEYFDDFSTNTASNYTVTSGSIAVSGGIMSITGVSSGNAIVAPTNQPSLASYVVEARAAYTDRAGAADELVGVLGFQSSLGSSNTGYVAEYGEVSSASKVSIERFTVSHLTTTAVTHTPGTYYLIKGVYASGAVKATFQRTTDASTADATYTSGSYGLRTYDADGTYDFWFVRKYAATEPSVAAPASEEKSPAPVAYWKFDEGTGTTANDSSSNKNNGTITGATWQTEDQCISGKCLKYDGTDDGVNTNKDFSWDNTTGAFTISTWIKPNSVTGDHGIIGKTSWEYGIVLDDNILEFNYWNTAGSSILLLESATTIETNKWYHVEVTFDGSTARLYINGKQEVTDSSISGTFQNRSESLKIGYAYTNHGSGAGTSYFPGFIDDVKIYNYSRTAAQVKQDYTSRGSVKGTSATLGSPSAGSGQLSNGLIGYWKMDESSWTGDCSTASVLDSSGNGLNMKACPNGSAATATPSAKFGNGGYFNGNNNYVGISSLGQALNTFTIAYWAKATALPARDYDRHFDSQDNFDIASDTSGNVKYYDGVAWTNVSTLTPAEGFNHFVFAYNGSTLTVYKNGAQVYSAARGRAIPVSNIGLGDKYNNGAYQESWPGALDEFRIYNRALTGAEVSQLYNFAPGPVGYWNFEEGQGITANDSSGNANTGTLTSSPAWTAGKYGKGISFNNNYVAAANESNFDFTSDFSVGFWINVDPNNSTSYRGLLAKWPGDSTGWDIGVQSGKVRMTLRGTSNLDNAAGVGTSLGTNTWHHVVIVSTPTAIYTYNDGVLTNTTTGTWTATTNSQPVWIGSRSGTTGFTGKLDDVKIYNYARTAKQIVSDMNAGHPNVGSPVGSAIGHWKFDEGYGTTANNSGSGAPSLKGTISGATWSSNGKFGKSLFFDGVNNYVTTTYANLTGQTELTVSAWINSNSISTTQNIISQNGPYFLQISGSKAIGRIYANSTWTSTAGGRTLLSNTWYYLSMVYDGVNIKVYVNGVLDNQIAKSGSLSASNTLYIGKPQAVGWDSPFSGLIDEVKLYNSALTSDEIKLDYNRGSTQVLGSLSDTSGLTGGSVASNSASAEYCIPGDTTSCSAPVGKWDFEEGNGSTVNDSSGNSNTGTWNGTLGSQWKPGKVGKGGNFNGSNNYVNLPSLATITAPYTVEFWMYPKTLPGAYQTILSMRGANSYPTFNLASNNKLLAYAGGEKYRYGTKVFASTDLNKWWHVTFTVNDSASLTNWKVYLNGVEDTGIAGANTGTYYDPSTSGAIGNNINGQYFNGLTDQVRIFNYARSAAQVAWDYNRGAPVGHWKMDECEGAIAHDAAFDAVRGGNNGTITIGGSGTQTSVGTCSTASTAWGNGATGKYNSSLNFDGTDDYVDAGSASSLDVTPITVSAWVKPAAISGQSVNYFASKYSATQGWAFGFLGTFSSCGGIDGTVLVFENGGGTTVCGTSVLSTGNWYHLLFTNDGTTTKIYVNGKLENSAAQTWTEAASTSFNIGRRSDAVWYTNGQIDDVRIYNYALTKQQIQQVYNQGSAVRFGPTTGTP